MTAALTSLAYFAAGALVPLIPWFLTEGTAAQLASVFLTAAASLVAGAVVGRSSDKPPLPARCANWRSWWSRRASPTG